MWLHQPRSACGRHRWPVRPEQTFICGYENRPNFYDTPPTLHGPVREAARGDKRGLIVTNSYLARTLVSALRIGSDHFQHKTAHIIRATERGPRRVGAKNSHVQPKTGHP